MGGVGLEAYLTVGAVQEAVSVTADAPPVLIVGKPGTGFTCSVAADEVAEPVAFVKTARYLYPF